jgi:hypothetical protein
MLRSGSCLEGYRIGARRGEQLLGERERFRRGAASAFRAQSSGFVRPRRSVVCASTAATTCSSSAPAAPESRRSWRRRSPTCARRAPRAPGEPHTRHTCRGCARRIPHACRATGTRAGSRARRRSFRQAGARRHSSSAPRPSRPDCRIPLPSGSRPAPARPRAAGLPSRPPTRRAASSRPRTCGRRVLARPHAPGRRDGLRTRPYRRRAPRCGLRASGSPRRTCAGHWGSWMRRISAKASSASPARPTAARNSATSPSASNSRLSLPTSRHAATWACAASRLLTPGVNRFNVMQLQNRALARGCERWAMAYAADLSNHVAR